MSGAPDLPASGMLHVQVAEDCTLDGGIWHLATDQHGAPTAQISPPAVPMFRQVVAYLEAKPVPPGGNMRRADEASKGLKKYGMFVADNGLNWDISIAPDPRIPLMHDELRQIKSSAFEVVEPPK